MEVIKMNKITDDLLESLTDEGCLLQPYTINGEEWLYIIHPAKSMVNEYE